MGLQAELAESAQSCRLLEAQLKSAHGAQEKLQSDFSTVQERAEHWRVEHQAVSLSLAELKVSYREKMQAFSEQQQRAEENRARMKLEFQQLAQQILDEKGQTLSKGNQTQIDQLLKPFRQQLESFERRVNTVHAESLKGQAGLSAEIKKVVELGMQMNGEAQNLVRTLKGDKKAAGQWGEAQLEQTLQAAGLCPVEHYEAQATFRDASGKNKQPDFVIKLPDNKHLVIDSKVSLIDYDKAMTAEADIDREQSLQAHVRAVRAHIDNLASKDYANLPGLGGPSFVLMFMPIEAAFIETLKTERDLFNQGYQKGVILVSHTTLMPILRTVANLWKIQHSHAEAQAISEKAGEIYKQVTLVAERMLKLGGSLNAVSNHYNSVVKAVAGQQGLYGKVERFGQLSAKAAKKLPHMDPVHADLEKEKLALFAEQELEPEA
jgi:DNA recombination protein RmuC